MVNPTRPVGIYGSYRIIEAFTDLPFRWQCAAWSGNGQGTGGSIQGRRLSQHAHLFQRVGYVLNDTCDVNDLLAADWGGWHPDIDPEEDMPLTDADASLVAEKVLYAISGRAKAQGQPWAQADTNLGDVVNAIMAYRGNGGAVDVNALAASIRASLGDALADELAKRLGNG